MELIDTIRKNLVVRYLSYKDICTILQLNSSYRKLTSMILYEYIESIVGEIGLYELLALFPHMDDDQKARISDLLPYCPQFMREYSENHFTKPNRYYLEDLLFNKMIDPNLFIEDYKTIYKCRKTSTTIKIVKLDTFSPHCATNGTFRRFKDFIINLEIFSSNDKIRTTEIRIQPENNNDNRFLSVYIRPYENIYITKLFRDATFSKYIKIYYYSQSYYN